LEGASVKVGLQVSSFSWPGGDRAIGPKLAEIGRVADDQGFTSFWVMDHFFQIEPMMGRADDPMLEAYTGLAYVAAVTSRIQLGALVSGVVYRQPSLLAKAVTTLDVLSNGRAWLGIGAAWYEREALGLGFTFPPVRERFERLEETLQIIKRMWSGDRNPFEGKHFQLAEPINSPQALSRPHPPILIGGGGEQKTLRLVARYGDACNLFAHRGQVELSRKLEVLNRHCDEMGRDHDDIERTALTRVNLQKQRPMDVIGHCRDLARLGFQHVILDVAVDYEISPLKVLGKEVIPAVAEL
jgi:F420-dependent oxidoreductase-like protein